MVTSQPKHNNDPHEKESSTDFESLPLHLTQMEKMAAIGQLSSSVAHEMRNLLGIIRTASFNISRAVQTSDPTINNNLEIISRSVSRAREFIDNLLNLSRVPRGREEPMDICQLVDDLLTLFSKEFEWRNIVLDRDYDTFPKFYVDHHKLQECLLNLIQNANQSMENGGNISILIKPCNNGVSISVKDTGCGISQEEKDRIFQQFYTTKTNGQGTGLGLTIARSLVQDLEGTIDVNSKPGKGSTFTIMLPNLQPVTDSNERTPITLESVDKIN